jgi:hypothetical protein
VPRVHQGLVAVKVDRQRLELHTLQQAHTHTHTPTQEQPAGSSSRAHQQLFRGSSF